MVGAPLWIAAHAVPTGEGFVNEASKNGYRLLLSLFAKPALIVFGFFLSLAMFSAGVYLVNNTFFTALKVVLSTAMSAGVPTVPEAGAAAAIGGGAALIGAGAVMAFNALIAFVFGMLAMIFILVSLYLSLAKWSFGLMNTIPDNALTWVGMQDISMGEERLADEALIGQAYMGARTVGGGASEGMKAGIGKFKNDRAEKVRGERETAADNLSEKRHQDMVDALRSGGSGSDAAEGAQNVSRDDGNNK